MKHVYIFLLLISQAGIAFAQKDPIEHIWYNASKTAKIEVYKAVDGNFYGKIIWLKEPFDNKNKSRTDIQNPKKNLQNIPLMNLLILKKFHKSAIPDEYENGTVYDPNTGKTWCGKLILDGKELRLKGYICGLSWFSRTSVWTLAE